VETLIGKRVKITGDVHFAGGLYVEGSITGAVVADQNSSDTVLTVAEDGRIEGEVHAPNIVINGELSGDVHASERVELGPNAKVQGNVHYKIVEMAAGAMLTGRLICTEAEPKRLTGPEETGK
jgi:cytoskeletal protein CcmA (bactofilin family)